MTLFACDPRMLSFDREQRNIRSLPNNFPASRVALQRLVGVDADPEKIWNKANDIEALLDRCQEMVSQD